MIGMPFTRRLVLATGLLASHGASAQSVDFRGLAGGLGGALAGAILADQQRQQLERMERIEQLRLQQLQDQNRLRDSQGLPVPAGNAFVPPSDQAPRPAMPLPEPAPFKVDDYRLGQNDGQHKLPDDFDCHRSEQFAGFQWCKKFQVNDRIPVYTSLLTSDESGLVYYNKFYGKAHFLRGAVQSQIEELSQRHREAARTLSVPGNADGLGGVIATWGALRLVPVNGAAASDLAAGKSVSTGIMVDFLGNPGESAKRGWPVFRIQGGSGYFWMARYDRKGEGILRFGICNASAFDLPRAQPPSVPAPPAVAQQPSAPPPVPGGPGPTAPNHPSIPAVAQQATPVPTLVASGIGDQVSLDAKTDGSAYSPAPTVQIEWSFAPVQSVR